VQPHTIVLTINVLVFHAANPHIYIHTLVPAEMVHKVVVWCCHHARDHPVHACRTVTSGCQPSDQADWLEP